MIIQPAWPEKIVLFLLALEIAALALLGATSPTAGTDAWFLAAPSMLRIPVITLLPVWGVLRSLDWIVGGPAKRRGAITVYPLR